MPLLDYHCPECNITFEVMTIKLSDVKEKEECPQCKKEQATRTIPTGGTVRFKNVYGGGTFKK